MALAAPEGAAVSGVVRDSQGVAQMGALVQLLASNMITKGTAFTDLHGRYVIANVTPGKYQVRASAALFVPAQRENLLLRSGARSVVNLTLNGLFDAAAWLPAERRSADEPGDDWKWTLRSAANRPILRMVDDGSIVLISSSAMEHRRERSSAKGAVTGGDGTFGGGGVHNIVSLDKALDDGSDVIFRAEMGTPASEVNGLASTEMQTGYQRKLGQGGASKLIVSYQSHPEITPGGADFGLNAMQVASAQRINFGDTVEIEAGNSLQVVRTVEYVAVARPFLRVKVHPGSGWALGYRMATSRGLQAFDGLDTIRPELPVAVLAHGRMQMESGLHQEFAVSKSARRAMMQVAYYRDGLNNIAVAGVGDFGGGVPAALRQGNTGYPTDLLVDTSNGSFRTLANGYSTQGGSFTVTQSLSPSLWAAMQYSTGAALTDEGVTARRANGVPGLHALGSQSATLALRGKVIASGTNVRLMYKWQPVKFVTATDPYAAFGDQAYLSFYVRQPLHCGNWLPAGLEATVDVTNLLAQGYHPFLSADGQTLYLAQSPRAIQAGVAFNF